MANRLRLAFLAAVLAGALLVPRVSHAAAPREALVIGNGTYQSLAPLPACLLSAHAVAAALHGAGFDVVEREDASSGAIDAALGEFAKHVADAPGAAAVIYFCGYATSFNNRPFLLPVSAKIARPADVLTQGVLAKSVIGALAHGVIGASLAAIDVVPTPDAPANLDTDALTQGTLPDGLGLIVASQAKLPEAPSQLATALAAALKAPQVQVGPLITTLQQQAGTAAVTVRPPVTPGYLVGSPPPPASPPPAPVAAAPAAPQATAAPVVTLPADDEMTDADRRTVQTALTKLGYYDGKVDGIFGPDTRAAIRRYQHELGADMTGKLGAAQASKLVGGK